jgi:hypothetical protein
LQRAPRIFEGDGPNRREIAGRFVIADNEVRVSIGPYDRRQALVIDPVLSYSTFLGGKGWEQIDALAVDLDGHAYVTGITNSVDYPNTFGVSGSGTNYDVFVTKLDVSGAFLHYSTFLTGAQGSWGIDVDQFGSVYVTGPAGPSFTPTPAAYQPVFGGGWTDAYVVKLDSAGASAIYATFLGGNQMDEGPIGISFCGRLTGGVGKSPAGAVWRAGEALEPLARAWEAPAARYAATGSRGAIPGGQGPPLALGQAGSGREVNPILPTLPSLRRARRRAGPPGGAGASPAAPGTGRGGPGSGGWRGCR